jgi:hypothetical protein
MLMMGLTLALPACRSGGALSPMEGGVEVALRRGEAWTTYTVRPPNLIGPTGTLEIRRGHVSGTIRNRTLSAQITSEGMTGMVGSEPTGTSGGTVELDIDGGGGDVEVSGLWGGQRVHVQITPESLRANITSPQVGHCQYVLDKVNADGARTGSSICAGLPEDTLLDFPATLGKWFSRNEMVAVLLVLLSSPPVTSLEGRRGI